MGSKVKNCYNQITKHRIWQDLEMNEKPQKLKVVIASVLAGGGHNTLRDFLYDQISKSDKYEVSMFTHPFRDLDKINNGPLVSKSAFLFNFFYKFLPLEVAYLVTLPLTKGSKEFLDKTDADLIICTYQFLASNFCMLRTLYGYKVPIVAAMPDYGEYSSAYYSRIKYLRPDKLIVFDNDTKVGLEKLYNLKDTVIYLTGYTARKEFLEVNDKYKSKEHARQKLRDDFRNDSFKQLDPGKQTVIFCSGSGGVIFKLFKLIKRIAAYQKEHPDFKNRYQFMVICGNNTKAIQQIKQFRKSGEFSNFLPIGWLNADEYAQVQYAADFPILGTLAPATMNELLATSCGPFLIYRTRSGHEISHLKFCTQRNFGVYLPEAKHLIEKLETGFTSEEIADFDSSRIRYIAEQAELAKGIPDLVAKIYADIQTSRKSKMPFSIATRKIAPFYILTLVLAGIGATIIFFFMGYFRIRNRSKKKQATHK